MNLKDIRSVLESQLSADQIEEVLEVITTLPVVEVKYTLGTLVPGDQCELKVNLRRLSKVLHFYCISL
jgi:phosphate starvation-inducible protein PhoH